MRENKEKDFRLHVKASNHRTETSVENIVCELRLPLRVTEGIEIRFFPTREQLEELKDFLDFSFYGEIKANSGEPQIIIQANRAYSTEWKTVYWDAGLSERTLTCKVDDLKITQILDREVSETPDRQIRGTFWLTPNIMLSPFNALSYSYTGEVTVENRFKMELGLGEEVQLTFDKHYRYVKQSGDEVLTFSELVAECDLNSEQQSMDSVLPHLDDLLMLISFATRHRCVCLGWEAINPSEYTRFFRQDRVIPSNSVIPSRSEMLIPQEHFKDFVISAYAKLQESDSKDFIRQAIYRTFPNEVLNLENTFISLYSALETVVLYFRHIQQLETTLSATEWKSLEKRLQKYLKQKGLPGDDNKENRALIYEKLPELNRVSFSTAFAKFCQQYGVEFHDLWPIVNQREGISLSGIRNRLVHGETFNPLEQEALWTARSHLKLIIERAILAVFGWWAHDSNISPYGGFTDRKEWREKWQRDRSVFVR